MSHGHHEIHIHQETYKFSGAAKTISLALIIIGLLLTIIGTVMLPKGEAHHNDAGHHTEASVAESEHAPATSDFNILGVDIRHNNEQVYPIIEHAKPPMTRLYTNLIMNGYFFLLIAVCGLFFFALQYIANAGWATAILRIPQAISTLIPIGAIVVLAIFFIDGGNIYHWVHYEHLHLKPGMDGYDTVLDNKSWFLNSKMAYGFIIGISLLWIIYGILLRRQSYREDTEGGVKFFNKSIRLSAAFTFLFAFTLSILSWVVCMSVDPHWYSTVFSIYNFATGWVTCLAVITLFVLYLKKNGYLSIVTDEHIHDLGKFMFAFSIFWTYLWLAQFLLIWYANIPEESVYYYKRWEMPFKIYWFANIAMNFLVPFLVLMTRNAKRSRATMVFVCLVIIFGHWVDLYLMFMPGAIDKQSGLGMLEIGTFMLFAGILIFGVLTALSKKGLLPIKHPYLEESAYHDVGV